MLNSSYYEAILQLRTKNDEVYNLVLNQVKKRKNIFVSKTVAQKNGLDVYLSDQKFAKALGKKLKNSFHGEVKFSRKLYGYNRGKGKKIYRLTVLFRLE